MTIIHYSIEPYPSICPNMFVTSTLVYTEPTSGKAINGSSSSSPHFSRVGGGEKAYANINFAGTSMPAALLRCLSIPLADHLLHLLHSILPARQYPIIQHTSSYIDSSSVSSPTSCTHEFWFRRFFGAATWYDVGDQGLGGTDWAVGEEGNSGVWRRKWRIGRRRLRRG